MKHGRPLISLKPKSKSELITLLLQHKCSPLKVAQSVGVTKVSVHNWINEYKVKFKKIAY